MDGYTAFTISSEAVLKAYLDDYQCVINAFEGEIDFIVYDFDAVENVVSIFQYLDNKPYQKTKCTFEEFQKYYPNFIFFALHKT